MVNSYLAIFLVIVSYILVFTLYYSIYTWIQELEKNDCKCSDLWQNNYLKYSSLVLLVNQSLFFAIKMLEMSKTLKISCSFKSMFSAWAVLSLFAVIVYMVILVDFIQKLKKKEDCHCSESWKREYGYYYSIVYLSLIALNVVLMILMMMFSISIIRF
jgi:hypothetical protein